MSKPGSVVSRAPHDITTRSSSSSQHAHDLTRAPPPHIRQDLWGRWSSYIPHRFGDVMVSLEATRFTTTSISIKPALSLHSSRRTGEALGASDNTCRPPLEVDPPPTQSASHAFTCTPSCFNCCCACTPHGATAPSLSSQKIDRKLLFSRSIEPPPKNTCTSACAMRLREESSRH